MNEILAALPGACASVAAALIACRSALLLKRMEQRALEEREERDRARTGQEKHRLKQQWLEQLLTAVGRDRIYQEGRRLLRQGWAEPADRANLDCIYLPYRELESDRGAEEIVRAVARLPDHRETEAERSGESPARRGGSLCGERSCARPEM